MTEPRPVRPAAVLWDMDGTLIDTEPYWMTAETELVAEWGGTWSHEDGLALVGSPLERSAGILRDRGVDLPLQGIIDLLTDRVLDRVAGHVPWRPGAREMLSAIGDAGVPAALVTMSIGRMARHFASAFDAELGRTTFAAIVAGDDVENGKPDPEAYLRAAELLGLDIAACVAIEDSEFGVAAAAASGAATIAVPLHVPIPASSSYAVWDTLAGRGVDDLAGVLSAHTAATGSA